MRSGRNSCVTLKKWAEEPHDDAERAIRLAGIAAGISTRSEEDIKRVRAELDRALRREATRVFDLTAAMLEMEPSSFRKRGVFDSSAATDPKWWLEQAVEEVLVVEDPSLRARVLLHLAKACQKLGSERACDGFIAAAVRCTDDVWKKVLERRGRSQGGHDGAHYWPDDYRVRKAELADVNALLDVLFEIEDYQSEIGKKKDALQTLLLALACAVSLPQEGGYAAPTSPDSFCCWLSRISGRANRRGRDDIAGAILIGRPWSQVSAQRGTDVFLAGLSAAEAWDTGALGRIADTIRQEAIRTHLAGRANYAARLYAQRALIAARAGDEEAYRQAAMTVGGLVNKGRGPASHAVLVEVAEAAAIFGV
jgi:hypothetical protein